MKIKCSFCESTAIYRERDGKLFACGNHAVTHLVDPRAIDPVSPEMAAQMADMLGGNDPLDDFTNYLEDRGGATWK